MYTYHTAKVSLFKGNPKHMVIIKLSNRNIFTVAFSNNRVYVVELLPYFKLIKKIYI